MNEAATPFFRKIASVAILILVMGCTTSLFFDNDETSARKQAGRSIAFVAHKEYQAECTSCHVGYLPGFLPERSWKKLMAGLEDHFGENASLDDPAKSNIVKFLTIHAADKPSSSARSKKIAKMIAASEAPLRITETPFWKRKHGGIKAYVWKREKVGSKSRCDACHRDAGKGLFDEHDVRIPK